jgi:hypothetical protein
LPQSSARDISSSSIMMLGCSRLSNWRENQRIRIPSPWNHDAEHPRLSKTDENYATQMFVRDHKF